MKLSMLDGLLVCRSENPRPVRLHAPRWYRLDRHLTWLLTPPERRGKVTIRFLGANGSMINREVRAIVVA